MEIKYIFRKLRTMEDHTQTSFAKELGVSQQWLSKVERGVSNPGVAVLIKLGARCDIPLPLFFVAQVNVNHEDYAVLNTMLHYRVNRRRDYLKLKKKEGN